MFFKKKKSSDNTKRTTQIVNAKQDIFLFKTRIQKDV